MKRFLFSLPLILNPMLTAAPLTEPSIIGFSNMQSSSSLSITADYGGFAGFGFSTASLTNAADGIHVSLPLGSGGYLLSNSTSQSIYTQASMEFSAPGYRIIGIQLLGSAVDDGGSAGEAFGISGPCPLSISGSESFGNRNCTLPDAGLTSGTITAWLRMYSDVSMWHRDRGVISNPAVELTMVHNPEPVTMILIGCGLIGIWAVGQKRPT